MNRFLLSSIIILLPLISAKPCGDYYNAEQVRVTNFMGNAIGFNELAKYTFSTNFYEYDEIPTNESYTENIDQWFRYCKNTNVDRKDIYNFLYVVSNEDVIKNKNMLLLENPFLKVFKDNQEVLDYLFLIKRNPTYDFKTVWDNFEGDVYTSYFFNEGTRIYPTQIYKGLLTQTKNTFLKRRYAYQYLVSLYYEERIDKVQLLNVFDTYFKHADKDWMYYSALHYAAYFMSNQNDIRLDCIMNGSDKQARNIELLYASPTFKNNLATEKDSIKKSYLLAIRAMRTMGPCLSDLKAIYQLNPKNIYFNFLLNREINKIEDWVLTPEFTDFEPYTGSEQTLRNHSKDVAYANDVLNFTSQLSGTNNAVFLTLVNSYLNYVLGKPEEAFNMLKNTSSYSNPLLQIQARTISLLIRLSTQKVDREVENEIVALIKLSPNLVFRNQLIRSCASLLFRIPSCKAKAFLLLSQSSYPRENFGNDLYDNLHTHASVREVYEVLKIIRSPNNLPLEMYISRKNENRYSWKHTMKEEWTFYDTLKIKNLIAMKHMNTDELEKALAVYNTFPDSYWLNSYFDDPFTFSIFDGHNHGKSDKIGYTKKQFLEKLISYKKALALKPNDALLNYYVGNAYLSLTWYGKNWYMSDTRWSSSGYEYRTKGSTTFENNYYKCARAIPYIKKAADNLLDKKIQTLAQLNLAYCYTIQKELPFKALLDTDTRAYYSEIELNCDVYVQYLNQYRLVDHNYTSMGRLKMFESFDDDGRYY
ncbi:hypothetical protein [uncultured Cytophaga sp.]|uniref:hypothetical protein n=1 Tax=uncultured Cytophaga sp. TaxID=160238 RepID=UPI0026122270|nr:hypothetical protein [uncultured Cytophaga sp.]